MVDKKYPVLEVDFGKPVSGYWDGGAKQHVKFSPTPKTHTNGKIEWGSWGANFYFSAKGGRSWTEAVSIAKRMLTRMVIDHKGSSVTVSWETPYER